MGNDKPKTHGGGKNTWSTILKIGGVGCAIVLLVGGILLGLGVFRAATCCSEFEELSRVSQEVQAEGHAFAMALHEGEEARAYDKLDDRLKGQVDSDAFAAQVEAWREVLDESRPFPMRLDVDQEDIDFGDIGGFDQWHLTTHFGAPDAERLGELTMLMTSTRDDDGEIEVEVSHWEMESVQRALRDDPYMSLALRFDDHIRRGEYEMARRLLSGQGDWAQLEGEEFERRVAELKEIGPGADERQAMGLIPQDHPDWIVARIGYVYEDEEDSYYDFTVGWRGNVLEFNGPYHWRERGEEESTTFDDEPDVDPDELEDEFDFEDEVRQ